MGTDHVHAAVHGFERVAGTYDRARPDYPPAAVEHLRTELDLRPGTRVLDLGAGTGKLTVALAASGASVTAVEPIRGMLDELVARLPDVEARLGTAEALPVADDSADAVTAAQAFHWFDADRALPEIARVLRPGGGLGLIWNRRDGSSGVWQELDDLLEPYRAGTPAHRDDAWQVALAASDAFGPLSTARFGNEQIVDRELLVARVASISFVSSLAAPVRRRLLADVRGLPDRLGLPARFTLPYETEVHVTRAAFRVTAEVPDA